MVSNGGLWDTFIQPFMPGYTGPVKSWDDQTTHGVLDIKEVFDIAMGKHSSWQDAYSAEGGPYKGITSILGANFRSNVVPALATIVGANVGRTVVKDFGIARSLNKLTRQLRLNKWVRW